VSGNPTNTVNLLASGGVALALDGSDSLIEAYVHHLPIKIVAPEFVPNPYSVLVVPSVNRWSDLKGKTIILGPKQDVSAVTFYRMIEAQHLSLDDFSMLYGGTSSSRYAALISGNVQATLLSQPFDILAQSHGMKVLGSASTVLKPWMDTSFAVNTTWAAGNRATAVHFVRALRKAAQFAYVHEDAAVAALVAGSNIDLDTATKAYALDFKQLHAFEPNLRINIPGLHFMSDMLVSDGAIAASPAMTDLVDESYVADAGR
jgi:NitT/TauT family transport system substrate-binding protein